MIKAISKFKYSHKAFTGSLGIHVLQSRLFRGLGSWCSCLDGSHEVQAGDLTVFLQQDLGGVLFLICTQILSFLAASLM